MVLVRFGWIHTKFRSFALVVWHRLQQRKLILAKNETHKKQKHNQNTESPKTTRQDSPEKTQRKNQKNNQNLESWQVLIILCFPSLFFFCVLWFCIFKTAIFFMLFGSKAWYTKRFKHKLLTVIFGSREKEESKMYERKGGQAHPSLEYISWISGFDMPIWLDFGHGWIWLDMVGYTQNPIKSFCMSLYTNKYYLTYFLDQEKKKVRKCMKAGGDRLTPPWNTFLG